jgi:hypothetical protein
VSDGRPPDERAEAEAFARGCRNAALVAVAVVLAVVVLVLLLTGCAGPGSSPLPRETTSSSTPASSSPPPVPEGLRPILDRLWAEGRHGCAEPSQLVTDAMSEALMREVDVPRLDARLVVGMYRDRVQCRGR